MAKKEVKTDLWVYDLLKQANINFVSIPANTTVTAVINMRAPADAAFDGLVAKNNYTINFKRAAMVSGITAGAKETTSEGSSIIVGSNGEDDEELMVLSKEVKGDNFGDIVTTESPVTSVTFDMKSADLLASNVAPINSGVETITGSAVVTTMPPNAGNTTDALANPININSTNTTAGTTTNTTEAATTTNVDSTGLATVDTATSPKTGDMSIPITFFALGGGSALAGLFAGRKKKADRDE